MRWLQWFFMSLKRFVVLDTLLIKRFPFSHDFSRFFSSILSITIYQQIGNFHFYFLRLSFLSVPFQFISNYFKWFDLIWKTATAISEGSDAIFIYFHIQFAKKVLIFPDRNFPFIFHENLLLLLFFHIFSNNIIIVIGSINCN